MVHHTMNTSNSSAPSASRNNKVMAIRPSEGGPRPGGWARWLVWAGIVGSLAACSTVPLTEAPPPAEVSRTPAPVGAVAAGGWGSVASLPPSVRSTAGAPQRVDASRSEAWRWADAQPLPAPLVRAKSVWTPVRWSELPGWGTDALHEAWNAWLRSCERPGPAYAPLCAEVRQLSIADDAAQHDWLMRRLQPYRVQAPEGPTDGLLTGYYEPMMIARRERADSHPVPLYRLPAGWRSGQTWFTRQEIDTLPQAQAALAGQAIAWLADPIDALVLQIQGSGRLQITEPDGRQRSVRLAFAGHNGQPYQSVGRWLLDQGAIREGSWEAIRAWARQNPQRVNEMLWANPRTVFFREEPLGEFDARFGPRGAQGVALTPGRSIAVDPASIPYGTPVWLRTAGPAADLQKLVLAQDTGGAILGPVRADYFTGWGDEAYAIAASLKQPVQLWALWPRQP